MAVPRELDANVVNARAAALAPAGSRLGLPPLSATPMAIVAWSLVALFGLLAAYLALITVVGIARDLLTGAQSLSASDFDSSLLAVFANTLIIVVASSGLALVIACTLAWIIERSDAGIGGVAAFLPLASLLLSSLAEVSGWLVLLEPRVGLLNGLARRGLAMFGVALQEGPVDIFSLGGMIALSTLQLVPFGYLIMSAALKSLDPSLEEASRVSHAGPLRTLVKVTLPAVAPAIANATIVTVIVCLGLFTVPFIIGSGAHIDVLSVSIYRLLTSTFPPRSAMALLLALVLVAAVQLLLAVQRRVARAGQHATVGGRGFRHARVALGRWRLWVRGVVLLYLGATTILPLLGLLLVSLQPFWTPDVQWNRLSLANYQFALFQNPRLSGALLRSLTLATLSATIGTLVAATLMLYVHQARGYGKQLVDTVTSLPAAIPHTVIGLSFLVAFSRPPIVLYGTPTMLLLAYLFMQMPFASRAAAAAVGEISLELAEASRVAHAGERRTFFRILLPLALPGLAAGWVTLFVFSFGEVTASTLLSGTENLVVGRVLLDLWTSGSLPQMTALALTQCLICAIITFTVLRLTRRTVEAAVR